MDNLDDNLELVKLALHQLTRTLCQVLLARLDKATFHDFLALFYGLLFALFDNFPKFIRKNVRALVELFLCLVIFAEIGEIIRKVVERLDEVSEALLFAVLAV